MPEKAPAPEEPSSLANFLKMLPESITMPRVEILEIHEETQTIIVLFEGEEIEINLGEETSYVAPPAAADKPSMEVRPQQRQTIYLSFSIELNRDVPKEFWEPLILHELMEKSYSEADAEAEKEFSGAHALAVNAEILYVLKYFPPQLQAEYWQFAEKYRRAHEKTSKPQQAPIESGQETVLDVDKSKPPTELERVFTEFCTKFTVKGYQKTNENDFCVYFALDEVVANPPFIIFMNKPSMSDFELGIIAKNHYCIPDNLSNIYPLDRDKRSLLKLKTVEDAIAIYEQCISIVQPWERELLRIGFERDSDGFFSEPVITRQLNRDQLTLKGRKISGTPKIDLYLELSVNTRQRPQLKTITDAIKKTFNGENYRASAEYPDSSEVCKTFRLGIFPVEQFQEALDLYDRFKEFYLALSKSLQEESQKS